ncbi:MAG: hypothetical protein ACI8PP_000547 [Candidatus Pseudothioglobus sp.]|jgi:hypothetical protein
MYIHASELTGMVQLYDLKADPDELDNLLPDYALSGIFNNMAARIYALLDASKSHRLGAFA